ncbi:hypothetical protein BT69DRAFT_1299754 [Atractiella rhizophila]|nr:hypothetical protein BT69DRAFT_1299754 [Atractiella rhizophila]
MEGMLEYCLRIKDIPNSDGSESNNEEDNSKDGTCSGVHHQRDQAFNASQPHQSPDPSIPTTLPLSYSSSNPVSTPTSSLSDNEEWDTALLQELGGPYFQLLHPDSLSTTPFSYHCHHAPFKSTSTRELSPYHPFKTEADFDMGSHVFHQGMTQRDTTAYFRNLKKHGLPHFTLDSFKDLRETPKKDRMSVTTEFQEHLISAEFDGKVIQHRIFLRDPIDIMKEVIRDDSTRQHMQFYPVKKFKRTGNPPFRKVRAYDELWTTKRWWKLQDLLPNHNGCIGAIILYSDGTNAVKFGQKTVHPISFPSSLLFPPPALAYSIPLHGGSSCSCSSTP